MQSLNERHRQSSTVSSLLDERQRDYYTQSTYWLLSMMNKQDQSSNVTDVASTTKSTCIEKNQHQTNHNHYQQRQQSSPRHNSCHRPHNCLLYCRDHDPDDSNSRAALVCHVSAATALPLSSQPAISCKNVASRTITTRNNANANDNDRRQSSTCRNRFTQEIVRGRKGGGGGEGGSRTRRCAAVGSSSILSSSSNNPISSVISLVLLSVVLVYTYQSATITTTLAHTTTISAGAGGGGGSGGEDSSSSKDGVEYEFKQAVNSTSGSQETSRVIVSRSLQAASDDDALSASDSTWRSRASESMHNLKDYQTGDIKPAAAVNISNVFESILKKRPYSKYWTIEQKWDDLFKRLIAVQGTMRQLMMKNFIRDVDQYVDLTISAQCDNDLKYIQNYVRQSTNFRWLAHMFDSTGKSEPGMLTGMMAHMGHPVQCIKVRAPARPSNDSFDERFFEQQTEALGERFRGKYCLASVRPVLPKKPHLVSRFSSMMNESMLSNISYMGESSRFLKMRARQTSVPVVDRNVIDRQHLRLDQVPFESELYGYLIAQRNFMFTLPRFMGVCYPSSCTRDDVRASLQRTFDDQHQVVDIEFECEQEEINAWKWFITPRLFAYVLLGLIVSLVFLTSLARYILLSKMRIRRDKLAPNSQLANLLNVLDMFSMDKCAGILFVKTKRASPIIDWTKVENNRSTSIDALRGFLLLVLIYSQLAVLGCLPVPFMWSKWSDAMFPFFRSAITQPFINMSIWTEAFYIISAYLIALKCFENQRPKMRAYETNTHTNGMLSLDNGANRGGIEKFLSLLPNLFSLTIKRYIRLVMPMLAFILFNYVWPRLSNGFVLQDQANKLMKPCDTFGWTNMLLFHNHNHLNETCLWPSHVSATFFQLHLLSYPLLALCLVTLYVQFSDCHNDGKVVGRSKMLVKLLTGLTFGVMCSVAVLASVYSALQASQNNLIVPFLIDYIDYDNYRRVLEWTVLPTYNHLTSYMFGLALAFIVARRKAQNELDRLESRQWFSNGSGENNCEGSLGSQSVRSSSTQELQDGLTFQSPLPRGNKYHISSGPSSVCASSQRGEHDDDDNGDYDDDIDTDASLTRRQSSSSLRRFATNSLSFIVLIGCLSASWFWNGLGQPMSSGQTFWYVFITKLGFCLAFSHLFHEHFATRRNSNNPLMITRFLVPIGRMSLSLFYMSWLVIWFDLLASLYQWHPSHYFIFEKYNEIVFIALILGMFVYGAFEGIIKSVQYATRLDRVKHDAELKQRLSTSLQNSGSLKSPGAASMCLGFDADKLQHKIINNAAAGADRFRVKLFESFFHPIDMSEGTDEQETTGQDKLSSAQQHKQQQLQVVTGDRLPSIHGETGLANIAFSIPLDGKHSSGVRDSNPNDQQQQKRYTHDADGRSGGDGYQASSSDCNLSPSDRYKLNAELRANYSFASIGLYENAGATGDLTALNSSDLQESPAISPKH